MRPYLAATAVLLGACLQLGPQNKDDNASDPVDAGLATPLIGFWSYEDSAAMCVYTLTFGAPTLDGYKADTFCQLADGTLGIQSRVGTYAVPTSGTLAVTTSDSTCVADNKNERDFTFARTEQGLSMASAEGTTILYLPSQRGTPKVPVSSGCFGLDGSFTQSDLKPL
jgi:hypothetical protein